MTANVLQLIAACLTLVLLTLVVGMKMFASRVGEMRSKRIHPQTISTFAQITSRLENTQAADNFRNLFETPVLFYALVAIALAIHNTPGWLVMGCWLYVVLRVLHSFIQCTYNKVMHRFVVFVSSFVLLVVLWVAYFVMLSAAA
jgi:hypothetical protein